MTLVAGQRQRLHGAAPDVARDRWRCHDHQLDLARDQIGSSGTCSLVGNVREVEAGRLVQQHAAQMRHRPGTDRGVVQLALVRLGVGDEVLESIGGHLLGDHDDMRRHGAHGHTGKIVRLPVEVLDQRRIGRVIGRILHQQRVAVGFRARDDCGPDIAVAAPLVVDQHLLAEFLRQQVRVHASHEIGAAARWRRHDHGDRLVGPILRPQLRSRSRDGEGRAGKGEKGATLHEGGPPNPRRRIAWRVSINVTSDVA